MDWILRFGLPLMAIVSLCLLVYELNQILLIYHFNYFYDRNLFTRFSNIIRQTQEAKMKGKYLYSFLAAGLILSVPLIVEARIAVNGVALNGMDLNTNQITPAATNSTVRVEGGQLVIQAAQIAQ
jgi:hypothetical protein